MTRTPLLSLLLLALGCGGQVDGAGPAGTGAELTGRHRHRYDVDGLGSDDVIVFREGVYWVLSSETGQYFAYPVGELGDRPVVGDYDGDGKADLAVFHHDAYATQRRWKMLLSSGVYQELDFGDFEGIEVPADYDGDGKMDLAVYIRWSATWEIRYSSTGEVVRVAFGNPFTHPMPQDYDGDGKDDIGTYDAAAFGPGGLWQYLGSADGAVHAVTSPPGQPMRGDFDGDGKADPAVRSVPGGLNRSPATWHVRAVDGADQPFGWGFGGDTPVPADYDGDGKTDIAVRRPSDTVWYIVQSSQGDAPRYAWWGLGDDLPAQWDLTGL